MVKENGNTGIDIVDPDPSLSWRYGLWQKQISGNSTSTSQCEKLGLWHRSEVSSFSISLRGLINKCFTVIYGHLCKYVNTPNIFPQN